MEDVRFNASSFSSRHSEILEWKLGKKLEEMTLEHVTHPFQEHFIQRLAIRHEKITYPWIRLRGNQQETLVFPNKNMGFLCGFPLSILIQELGT